MKTTAYFAAPVRGKLGDAVDPQQKLDNVRRGIQIGCAIRKAFPWTLDLFIPHEHEIIIDRLWRNGLPSRDIIEATAQEAASRDFLVVYDGDGVTEGMAREIDVVHEAGKPVVYFDNFDEETVEEIANLIAKLQGGEKKEKFNPEELEDLGYRPKGETE